jgi:hypothetical protein
MRARQAEAARERLAKEASGGLNLGRRTRPSAKRAVASVLLHLLYRRSLPSRAQTVLRACQYVFGRFEARGRRLPSGHSA